MSSQPAKRVFISGASVDLMNDKTRKQIGALINSTAGMALKADVPKYRAGLLSHLSDEAREAFEAQITATAQTLSAHLPQMPDDAFKFEVPEHVLDRFSGDGATQLGFETAVQPIGSDFFEALEEAVPAEEPSPKSKKKKRRRASTPEQIATRVIKRQRQAVLSLLKVQRFAEELKEFKAIEAGLREGTKRSCKLASFNARNLMEGLADQLYPATSETRRGRDQQERSLGSKDFKNRLIAYVEDRLEGKLEGHDFRSFVSTMDTVFRWTGSGPHGAYGREEAEHVYPRLLEALALIARAHAV